MKKIKNLLLFVLIIALVLSFSACDLIKQFLPAVDTTPTSTTSPTTSTTSPTTSTTPPTEGDDISFKVQGCDELITVPAFSGEYYVAINDCEPFFSDSDLVTESYEKFSPLDEKGRCGVAIANIGVDIMPTDDRESINSVTPTGWAGNNNKYDFVDASWIYNRCHIIGFQLTGENANKLNLITGTRALNVDAMLLFENLVADYVKETENHVLYRVTPIFNGDNLVVDGVLMEGKSVEDDGEGILFNYFCYNSQQGVTIDYTTGKNWANGETPPEEDKTVLPPENEEEVVKAIDTNGNGKITIAEAEAAGYKMPITSAHWIYKYMTDSDGDGTIG